VRTIGGDDATRAKTRFSRWLNFRVFQQYRRLADIADRGLGRLKWADSCPSVAMPAGPLPRPKRSISHFGWNAFLSAMFARVDLAEGRRHVSPARLRAGSATGFAGRRRCPHANLGARRWPIAGMLPFRSTAERCSLAPHRPTWDQFGLKRHRRAAREEALHVGQDRFAYA
jgi:hypothetical protein